MREVNSVLEVVKNYTGESILGILFLVCLISMISKAKSRNRKYILWIVIFSILLVFNNIAMKLMGMLTDSATYYRFLWAVPVTIVVGYVFVEKLTGMQEKMGKVILLGLGVLILALGGTTYISKETVQYPGTTEKIPQDVKTICQVIEENKISERPVCVFDSSTQLMVRAENPSIVWAVNRETYLYLMENGYDTGKYKKSNRLVKVVNSGIKVKRKRFMKALNKKNVEFLVIKKEFQMTKYLAKMGIYPVGESDNYIIYQYIREEGVEEKQ